MVPEKNVTPTPDSDPYMSPLRNAGKTTDSDPCMSPLRNAGDIIKVLNNHQIISYYTIVFKKRLLAFAYYMTEQKTFML